MKANHTATHIQIALFILLNIVLVAVGTVGGFYVYEGYKEKLLMEQNISAAQAPKATAVTVDFGTQISTGSPLTFGGAHYPPLEHQDAWNKLEQVGMTSLRVDLALENLFPKNEKVNENELNLKKSIFMNAKKRGIKIIGIMDYAPVWLTYTRTVYGVPKDWDTYQQLVTKAYELYRPYLDYVEIWNEPNMPNDKLFLIPTGSGLSRMQAYERIYLEAATAIRTVDAKAKDGKSTPIGAQVSFTADDASYLDPLLDSEKTKGLVDFVSYHQYEPVPSNSISEFSAVTKKYGKPELPIFATEWSYSSKGSEIGDIITKPVGITYAASMLMNYFTMGVAGANYHTVTAWLANKPFGIEKNHAFYTWSGNKAELLPLAKSWQLLSKTMGLGQGKSTILKSTVEDTEDISALAFVNSKGEKGTVLINQSDTPKLVHVTFQFPGAADWARIYTYDVTEKTDFPTLRDKEIIEPSKNTLSLKLYVAPGAVTGILLKPDVSLPEQLRYRLLYH